MATDYSKTDQVVDDLIKKYANAKDTTLTDLVRIFFKGAYSYPDDVGMSIAVTVSGLGLLGPGMQREAFDIYGAIDSLICLLIAHPPNLWYLTKKYLEYLETNGRWKARLASTAGRTAGGMLTNFALSRIQIAAGIDPKYVTKLDKFGVSVSLFVLAMYGSACHAVLAGERSFLGLLNRMITGEIDRQLGNIELDFSYDAPWRKDIPNNIEDLNSKMRPWLQQICQFNKQIPNR